MKQTASSYSYLWSHASRRRGSLPSYHYERMARALGLAPLAGTVLDAGCGEGIDLANQAREFPGIRLIGAELSEGGCRASQRRIRNHPSAHVVQADLCRLPFRPDLFDFIYSYGVLHHLPSPEKGLTELVRTLKPGGRIALYLYEDFSDRHGLWRALLRGANRMRRFTTRMPYRMLYLLCGVLSPWAYLLFAVPYRILRRIPGCRGAAEGIPFRHATGPFSLVGDMYDRFATPKEWRYSRNQAVGLMGQAGLEEIRVARERGWMLLGEKPVGILQEVAG